jgi:hypothetical protein
MVERTMIESTQPGHGNNVKLESKVRANEKDSGVEPLPDDDNEQDGGGQDDDDDEEEEEEERARFELELEFVQCLASPAYLHFLATYRDDDDDVGDDDEGEQQRQEEEDEGMDVDSPDDNSKRRKGTAASRGSGGGSAVVLQDPRFRAYLVYLRDTWSRPEYAVHLSYPHCLYFLNLLIEHPNTVPKEWALPAYRNFCHQQQFLAWQHRHSTLYGAGGTATATTSPSPTTEAREKTTTDGDGI